MEERLRGVFSVPSTAVVVAVTGLSDLIAYDQGAYLLVSFRRGLIEPLPPQTWEEFLPGAVRPPGGGTAWGLGFLAYLPFPVINVLAALLGVGICFLMAKQPVTSATVRSQARSSLNWHLTLTLFTLVLPPVLGVLSWIIADAAGQPDSGSIGAMIGLISFYVFSLVGGICHLVLCIRGLIFAGRAEVYRPVLAIPFLRER
ncbi:DUF4870 domain-containing protein [Nesterenkonia flava]|uniref:DUF4870 domain-containing protein n=1 Tax=Nesterenkonia flava TaxID=469799 RepID=UPI0031D51BC5